MTYFYQMLPVLTALRGDFMEVGAFPAAWRRLVAFERALSDLFELNISKIFSVTACFR